MVFNSGDIVVCICIPNWKIFGKQYINLQLYKTYLVIDDYSDFLTITYDVDIKDTNNFIPVHRYPKKYFVSLQEFRKMKINKILNE